MGSLETPHVWGAHGARNDVDSTITYLTRRSEVLVRQHHPEYGESDRHELTFQDSSVRIHDMRPIANDLSLDGNGFILQKHQVRLPPFLDLDALLKSYVP